MSWRRTPAAGHREPVARRVRRQRVAIQMVPEDAARAFVRDHHLEEASDDVHPGRPGAPKTPLEPPALLTCVRGLSGESASPEV